MIANKSANTSRPDGQGLIGRRSGGGSSGLDPTTTTLGDPGGTRSFPSHPVNSGRKVFKGIPPYPVSCETHAAAAPLARPQGGQWRGFRTRLGEDTQ